MPHALTSELGNVARKFKKTATPRARHKQHLPRPRRAHSGELFREYYSLYKIAATLTAEMDIERTLRETKKTVRELFQPQQYSIMLRDGDSQTLRIRSHFGFSRRHAHQFLAQFDDKFFGKVLRRKQVVHIPDLETSPPHCPERSRKDWKKAAFVALPLFIHGQPTALGVLNLYRRPGGFSATDIRLLRKIAAQLAQVLDKISLYHQTRALSITDSLTGIHNRRHFNERYAAEFMRAARYGRPLSVIMLDIDHFKIFNDTHGHLLGDRVLRMAAQVLEENIRKADLLARYGGEEFVVILPEIDKAHGRQVAEKLRRAIASAVFPKAEQQPFGCLTTSVGLASYPEDAQEGNALLALADQALYEAKACGRNQVAVASEGKIGSRNQPAARAYAAS